MAGEEWARRIALSVCFWEDDGQDAGNVARPQTPAFDLEFMAKQKRNLSKAEKARRRAEFMTVFVNGKQKRVRRPLLIDGMNPDEFIRQNADEIWLHQNEMWEEICVEEPPGFERNRRVSHCRPEVISWRADA